MTLGRLRDGAYVAFFAFLFTLCMLLIAFLLIDSHQWHILPQHRLSSHAHLLDDRQALYKVPSSALLDLKNSSEYVVSDGNNSHTVNGSFSNEISHQPLNSTLNSSEIEVSDGEFHGIDDKLSFSEPALLSPPEVLSLRSLEAGLRAVRWSMRRAAKAGKNASRALQADLDQSSGYVPVGPIYRDASIFHQSYVQMERRFKVFIYPEGEQPLVHNGPCKEIYSTEGRFIQDLQHKNPFVTDDPFKAHVFFLPFSVSMMVTYLYNPSSRDMNPLLHFVKDYVQVVGAKYPFWNRSTGADHFMLSCHDWGPHISTAHPHLGKRAIRVLCNANSSEGFMPRKDASLPEVNLVGGHIPAALGGPAIAERPFLAFFAGQDHGPARPLLHKHWEGRDDSIKVFHNLPSNANYSYHDYMKRSKYCLCPSGYEVNSPRIVEAIYNDCIPVIIADGFVLPFSDVLNWSAFSIKILQKDIPDLKNILEAIPDSQLKELQEGLRQVRRHFLFNQPRPQPYDLFHMILHSVWLRRLNIRLNYN